MVLRRLLRPLGVCVLGMAAFAASASPVVPGVYRLQEAKLDAAAQGELLLTELNCVSCHAAPATRLGARKAPDLTRVGSRLTPQYIRAYLTDPEAIKPGVVMPDLFHASAPAAKAGAIDFLVHFLVSQGGPIAPSKQEATEALVTQGRALYHTIGCVACHAPEKPIKEKIPSIPHGKLAMATTVEQLTAFLLDPSKARPGGRMPSLNLKPGEAQALAVYLLRDQLDNPQTKTAGPVQAPGLHYAYYQAGVANAKVQTLDTLKPTREGTIDRVTLKIPGRRNENFALKFTGMIAAPKDGKYRFYTASDDGSRLYIDGNLVLDNDGDHPRTEVGGDMQLTAGRHAFVLTYYEHGGPSELQAYWEGPGFARQEIAPSSFSTMIGRPMVPLATEKFVVDPQKAAMGRQMFTLVGCANCHAVPGAEPQRPMKPLASLDATNTDGCLSPMPKRGVPQYHLSDAQRGAIEAALANRRSFATALEPKQQIVRTMAAMNCYACHRRNKVGGPTKARDAFFKMTAEFDMGEEGRIPPLLTAVGYKLLPAALEQIIYTPELRIRPALATRMPRFSRQAIPDLVDLFIAADTPAQERPAPTFAAAAAHDGRILVGTKGYGCVNCHSVNDVKSLGMPGPDLNTIHDRIRYAWFRELLLNPAEKNAATRMPQFWFEDGPVSVKGYGNDTRDGQIDAIWDYLSLGRSMALPPGMEPSNGLELTPTDRPIIFYAFMHNVSPRTISVGYPEQVHVAFDANAVRLAKAWRGKFLDVRPSWESRGGGELNPIGTDVIDLPAGPSFALLASPNAPWPVVRPGDRNVGGHFLGYTLDDKGVPTFGYRLGGVTIHETEHPILLPGGSNLSRRWHVSAGADHPSGLTLLVAAGRKIEAKSPGTWVVDGHTTVKLNGIQALARQDGGVQQLVAPVVLDDKGEAAFSLEMAW